MKRTDWLSARSPWTWTPPALALTLLLTLPLLLARDLRSAPTADVALAQLQQAFRAAPYRVGDWVGEDVAVPTAAIEMLRPSAVLSRRFRNVRTGGVASLVIVHCSDGRDMGAHYPPNCYPAQGWHSRLDGGPALCEVPHGDTGVPLRIYEFTRGDATQHSSALRVLNCFVQRDGTFSPDRPKTNYLLERHRLSAYGIAQIQIVTSGQIGLQESTQAATELLLGHAELIATLSHRGDAS